MTATPITVGRATLADLDALARLFDGYRVFQGQPSDPPAARAFLEARLSRNEAVLFIAADSARAIGFTQLYPSFSSVALARVFILNDLFVAEGARHRQVAGHLLAAVERYAWEQGASRITLNVARVNEPAQNLYRKHGWVQDQQFFMFHRYPPPEGNP